MNFLITRALRNDDADDEETLDENDEDESDDVDGPDDDDAFNDEIDM